MNNLKRKLTACLVTLSLLLALAPPATAHTVAGPVWEGQASGQYSYYIWMCDIDISDANWEARIVDAANTWDGIGGELVFINSGWTSQQCQSYQNSPQGVVVFKLQGLPGDALAQAYTNLILGQIDECVITLDYDFTLATFGSYSFYAGTGSPSSSQVDLESVVLHELGHCAGTSHTNEDGYYRMNACMNPFTINPPCSTPKGIEKDAPLYTHDKATYIQNYGTTH